MKIAVVYTVKNEERLLKQNILFHKAIGIEHFFVYLDNSTDHTEQSINDLPYVEINKSVSPKQYLNQTHLEKFTSKAEHHHTARQCLNTYNAKEKCEEKGIDWLISIDADELFIPSTSSFEDVKSFFQNIDEGVDIIDLKVFEALQRKKHYNNVFAEETIFKLTRKFNNRFEKIYKYIYNPIEKRTDKFFYWYGHFLGKSAIRVSSKVMPKNVHRYVKIDGTTIGRVNKGYVLHYHFYDAKDFIKKFNNFKKHPKNFISGARVGKLKLLLRDVVNFSGMDEQELEKYFCENLMFSEKEVKALQKNMYMFVLPRSLQAIGEITNVREVFEKRINTALDKH